MRKDKILDKLGEMEVDGKWKKFDSNRYGKELMIELVKYRIDVFRDFEVEDGWLRFRKIVPPNEIYDKNGDITYRLVFQADTGELTEKEKNLPDPEWKSYSKVQWDKLIGRK